ncbi:histone H2B-like [Pelodytes ibericus]
MRKRKSGYQSFTNNFLSKTKKKRRRQTKKKRRRQTFSSYVRKVRKEVHPDLSLSSPALEIMTFVLNTFLDRIATEAGKLVRDGKRRTLSTRNLEGAIYLLFPGQIAKYAILDANKAVAKYTDSLKGNVL